MAKTSRAAMTLDTTKRSAGNYGWRILRGTRVAAVSVEGYARTDSLKRAVRHMIRQIAPQVGLTVGRAKSPRTR